MAGRQLPAMILYGRAGLTQIPIGNRARRLDEGSGCGTVLADLLRPAMSP